MKRLSDLQGIEVVDGGGNKLGRIFEVVTVTEQDALPVIKSILVGRGGLARRLGIRSGNSLEIPVREITFDGEGGFVRRDVP